MAGIAKFFNDVWERNGPPARARVPVGVGLGVWNPADRWPGDSMIGAAVFGDMNMFPQRSMARKSIRSQPEAWSPIQPGTSRSIFACVAVRLDDGGDGGEAEGDEACGLEHVQLRFG